MTAPLTRDSVSQGLRVLLPTIPVATLLIGVNYTLTPRSRLTETPVFEVADQILPMPMWGAAFLAVTVALNAALLTHRATLYVYSLSVLVAVLIVWSLVFALAAAFGQGSPSAWVWPAFAAVTCWAVIRSLTSRGGKS